MILHLLAQAPSGITWVKVQKPVFDLAGVLVSSLTIAGLCVAAALVLGSAYGLGIILRARRHPRASWGDGGLHLLEARRP